MSFVSEHYSTVFRALARDVQDRSDKTASLDGTREYSADVAIDLVDVRDKLAKRAFDLSTQLLVTPDSIQKTVDGPYPDDGSESEDESSESKTENDGALRHPNSFSGRTPCPEMSSVASDLQLVEQAIKGQDNALLPQQMQQDIRIVVLSSISAIQAHSISSLLELSLPLSVDLEYWSAQESSTLSVMLYFIQSFPQRLYLWFMHTTVALLECPEINIRNLREQLCSAMPKTLLFPDLGAVDADNHNTRSRRSRLALFSIPKKVNIMSLTRREIRNNQAHIVEFQEKLALSIGLLSQTTLTAKNRFASTTRNEANPGALLQQIDNVLLGLNADASVKELPSETLDYSNIADVVQKAKSVALQVCNIPSSIEENMCKYRRPSLLSRSWLPAVFALAGAKYLSSYVYGHQDDFKEWTASGLVTLRNYVIQYILQPLRSGYETIRYGKHTYNVFTQESLVSDFKSLEDMVLAFAKRFGTVDPAEIKSRVESGDLSDVMHVYAQEMQQPLRNAVFGDLVQAILIQIQKVKVDVGQTMAALDKLLKSNELNFLLLSTVPATLSIYAGARWILRRLSWLAGGKERSTITSIQLVVRDIDRLLNNASNSTRKHPLQSMATQEAATHGRIICLTHYLRHHAQRLPNTAMPGSMRTGVGWCYFLPHTRALFMEDIRDIESVFLTNIQKRNVIDRMYRTFQFL
ncbi:Nuclear control of ATPase protein 2 [Coemansia sp. RSA 1804]|nr:Nuclear control of ATPase protein 2 [Coemansia sp. RSA 1804]